MEFQAQRWAVTSSQPAVQRGLRQGQYCMRPVGAQSGQMLVAVYTDVCPAVGDLIKTSTAMTAR